MSAWSNVTVRTRIFLGFLLVLLILVALSTTSYLAFATTKDNVQTYVQRMDVRAITRLVDRDALVLRRVAREFGNWGKETDFKASKDAGAVVRQHLKEGMEMVADPERRARLDAVSKSFEGYMSNLDQLWVLKSEQNKLVADVLDPAGEKTHDAIKVLQGKGGRGLTGIMEHGSLVRLYVNQMIGRRDISYGEKAQAEFTALQSDIASEASGTEDLKSVVDGYEAGVGRYLALSADIDRLMNKVMVQQVGELADNTQKVVDSADSEAKQIQGQTQDTIVSTSRFLLWASIIGLCLGGVLAFFLGNAISGPLVRMTQAMRRLADGDKTVEIPGLAQKDEIGLMAGAVQVFKDNAIRMEAMRAEQEEQKRRAEQDRQIALRKMADSFEAQVGGVVDAVTAAAVQLQASSKQMAATAHQTSAQATTVAAAAEEASGNVQTVAAATEELSSSINEIATQVDRSQNVAARANDEAQHTSELISRLSENVGSIGEIIALINDIASQTNLLALNATIEAARAGDAGKGFAVVASEVKSLATQTARATDDIANKILAIQNGTTDAVQAIGSIAAVITEVSEISSSVASAVQEQTAATSEIARNVDQASSGTQDVSRNIGQVEMAARETGHAASQINESASELSHQADILKGEVSRFLDQVRSDKKNMRLFTWDAGMDIGVVAVDRHHRHIFDELNRYFAKMMHGEGDEAVQSVVALMDGSMRSHFTEEEEAMSRQGFPKLAQHRLAHEKFFGRFDQLKKQVAAGDANAASALFEFAADWFREHIQREDKPFADFLQERKAA